MRKPKLLKTSHILPVVIKTANRDNSLVCNQKWRKPVCQPDFIKSEERSP
jgi:hypothetical protein